MAVMDVTPLDFYKNASFASNGLLPAIVFGVAYLITNSLWGSLLARGASQIAVAPVTRKAHHGRARAPRRP